MKELFSLNQLRRPKISKKAWITLREFPKYFEEILWLSGLQAFRAELSTFRKRIQRLIRKSGFNFTFQYLKLVLHFVVAYLSGRPVLISDQKGPYISLDSRGLPSILPLIIRDKLDVLSSKEVGGLLSILSIFRVFPTKVKPKFDTISDEFSGSVRSFDHNKLKLALDDFLRNKDLNRRRFKISLIGGESAGPNGFKALWMASIDAFAFLYNPVVLFFTVKWLWRYGKPFLLWFFLIISVGIIPYVILHIIFPGLLRWVPIKLGKLSVVYNTAGKARVVAMTNWWIQLCFKPLHNRLFDILRQEECDGTFNQDLALDKFLSKFKSDHLLSSYDLSAATDRLPINIQSDILDQLYGNKVGHIWSNIISNIDWYIDDKKSIRYAVGQPMGAYSSWAMLAITHHVIVRAASTDLGLVDFRDYVVLGDDFAINNDEVGSVYLKYMRLLGVEINLSKSVISSKFCEFAKRLKGPSIDITPIGPGLILRFVRDRFYIGNVIREAFKLKWMVNTNDVLIPMLERWPKRGRLLTFVLWVCLGSGGAFMASPVGTDHPLTDRMVPTFIGRHIASDNIMILHRLQSSIGNAFIKVIRRDLHARDQELIKAKEYFYLNWYDTFCSKLGPIRILELILLVLNPGLWYIALSLDKAEDELTEKFNILNRGFSDWDSIRSLTMLDDKLNIANVDWTNRREVKNFRARAELFLSTAQSHWDYLDPVGPTLKYDSRKGRINIQTFKPRIRVAVF